MFHPSIRRWLVSGLVLCTTLCESSSQGQGIQPRRGVHLQQQQGQGGDLKSSTLSSSSSSSSISLSSSNITTARRRRRSLQSVEIIDATSNSIKSTESKFDHEIKLMDYLSFHWNDPTVGATASFEGRMIHKSDSLAQAPS